MIRRQKAFLSLTAALICLCFLMPFSPRADCPGTVRYWVTFTDKKPASEQLLTKRALARRNAAGIGNIQWEDFPVDRNYIASVERAGGVLRNIYKWENAASFRLGQDALAAVKRLPYVKSIEPVRVFYNRKAVPKLSKLKALTPGMYGAAFRQLSGLTVVQAHDYVQRWKFGMPGTGVLVGFFDSGFSLAHDCFSYVKSHGAIAATRDFIDNDTTVADPDSVRNDPDHIYNDNDTHGSQTLALVAGCDPGYFMGVAWGARFVLARTEDTRRIPEAPWEVEEHTEEDNWAAAVVWAESLGVDIVSSSLGYRYDFTDSIGDYTYDEMDGKTAICSRAAARAAALGMIVVNAVGNDGADSLGTLNAPADADGVVAVGAVDAYGNLAGFSSTGPSFDGRIKPDCVAPGVGVAVPVVNTIGAHSYSNFGVGTSFATPLVAGVCALILQSHPGASADSVKKLLFNSCGFLPDQDSVDNYFGRGIPDALKACLRDDLVWIRVIDTKGKSMGSVNITESDGSVMEKTDTSGVAIFQVSRNNLPFKVALVFGSISQPFTISSTPLDTTVVINIDKFSNPLTLFPSVLRSSDSLTAIISPGNSDEEGRVEAVIRASDGTVVWKYSNIVELSGKIPLKWSCRAGSRRAVPGLYFFIVKFSGKTYGQKFLITG